VAYESVPPRPDEEYWQALLSQGEFPPPPSRRRLMRRRTSRPPGTRSREYLAVFPGTEKEEDWARAEEDMAQHRVLELEIIGCNKGGVLVGYHSIIGFVPTSHMLNLPRLPEIEERLRVLSSKIGEKLRLRIIEIDRSRGRLILSERAALEDERALQLWATVQPGDVLEGKVTRLERYGAFVDVGGVEGLVHVSELSWARVSHPGDVVQPGDHVRVYVLAVKPNERKIALSLKRLQPDPWNGVSERFHPGDVVTGVVTHVASFGAFVQLEEGVEGLVHRSELSSEPFHDPGEVVVVGQAVKVRVLHVDEPNRRIALSLREV